MRFPARLPARTFDATVFGLLRATRHRRLLQRPTLSSRSYIARRRLSILGPRLKNPLRRGAVRGKRYLQAGPLAALKGAYAVRRSQLPERLVRMMVQAFLTRRTVRKFRNMRDAVELRRPMRHYIKPLGAVRWEARQRARKKRNAEVLDRRLNRDPQALLFGNTVHWG